MNEVIYQSVIIHLIVLSYGDPTYYIDIKGSEGGLINENGTQIECSYTPGSYIQLSVTFLAFKKSSTLFESIAIYIPDQTPILIEKGEYLKGRVTLTPITQSSKEAVLTFNKLMCIDDTFYKCKVFYQDSSGPHLLESENISISVQVPPSKPDDISLFPTPADSSVITTSLNDYSSSSPSTAEISNENETVSFSKTEKQNTTPRFNHSTIQTTGNNSTTSTSSPISYRTTTYSLQQTTNSQGIAEGNNITAVCTGDVGNPPAEHAFEKHLNGKIIPMQDTVITTSIPNMPDNCSYYRTSNLTFQVSAEDNLAVIRCVVNSSMADTDMYIDTEPIEVYYEVSTPTITKYPNKTYYVVGEDTSIQLTCKSDGNPQPDYYLYKENSDNPKSASENLTIKVMNKTDSGVYICDVNNTFNGGTYTRFTKIQVHVITKAETSTIPSSSPGSSSGTDEKYGNEPEDLTWVYVGVSVAGFIVILAVLGCYLFIRKRPTSQQPVIYAEVNKATKSKNRQETSNQQDDDTYAGTQEGIYDQSGNRRHKENENAEQFDKIGDIKKKPGTDDAESSVKSNQKGSYVNQALNKGEKQVATVPPISRSSSGSQGYEQTSELSQKGYENVKGTDNTHTSDGHTINQTSF